MVLKITDLGRCVLARHDVATVSCQDADVMLKGTAPVQTGGVGSGQLGFGGGSGVPNCGVLRFPDCAGFVSFPQIVPVSFKTLRGVQFRDK